MRRLSARFIPLLTVVTLALGQENYGNKLTFGMKKVASATNQFGIDMFRTMTRSHNLTSMAFSPLSVSTALAAIMLGSRGETTMTLRHALYLWGMYPDAIHQAYRDLLSHIANNLRASVIPRTPGDRFRFSEESDNELLFYSSMYVQRDYAIKYPFQKDLLEYYNTTVHPLDFVMSREETKDHINAVVAKQTNGRIMNILPDMPPMTTNILFLNGLHFVGSLDMTSSDNVHFIRDYKTSGFRPQNSRYNSDDNPLVKNSKQTGPRYGEHAYLNARAVEIPFRGGLLSLVILLPKEPTSMSLLETRLSAQRLSDVILNMHPKSVNLKMPHIKTEENHRNMLAELGNMGLGSIFTPGYASLYGMSDFRWLHITDIIHKACVEIKGVDHSTTATTQSGGKEVVNIILDRPFMYFIMDNVSGLVIAMGKFSS
ncbi:leukocyte elastase inhibitor-like [Limulus polyphemus]|uniref:Leukocyte elastase inhibitor-like n=1 Tax=Limulus polyphemus TaxID=6850 RepID=A0ABM1BID3_LIMPO|nr:leukocyte elastase inhibitor-like [Limulus polyphemus]